MRVYTTCRRSVRRETEYILSCVHDSSLRCCRWLPVSTSIPPGTTVSSRVPTYCSPTACRRCWRSRHSYTSQTCCRRYQMPRRRLNRDHRDPTNTRRIYSPSSTQQSAPSLHRLISTGSAYARHVTFSTFSIAVGSWTWTEPTRHWCLFQFLLLIFLFLATCARLI